MHIIEPKNIFVAKNAMMNIELIKKKLIKKFRIIYVRMKNMMNGEQRSLKETNMNVPNVEQKRTYTLTT